MDKLNSNCKCIEYIDYDCKYIELTGYVIYPNLYIAFYIQPTLNEVAMMRTRIVIIIIITTFLSCRFGKEDVNSEKNIVLETEIGDIIIKLYPEAPVHSTNFENLVSKGVFDGILFHRVISNFMKGY